MVPHTIANTDFPGFTDPVHDSQRTFRLLLEAMAHPGRVLPVDGLLPACPPRLHPAAAAACLCLVDFETSVWVEPLAVGAAVTDYLRFHSGCPVTENPSEADFALLLNGANLPPLANFKHGTEEEPHRSATVIVQVDGLHPGTDAQAGVGWTLSGPGIEATTALRVTGLPDSFAAAWRNNRAGFPVGVDLLLTTATHVVALPRTTDIRE